MQNIKFSYLYRDGGNYKDHGSIVFPADNSIYLQHIDQTIRSHLIDGTWFYAGEWQIPDLYFEKWNNELDHTFHEFESVEYTHEAPNTLLTLALFISLIERFKL